MSNDDNGIRLTRRRLLGGVAATGAATAGLGAGTYALYSDSEQSTGNTVSSGTLDLSLTDPSGGSGGFSKVGQAPTGPFNAKPGHQFKFKLTINNNGSIRGDYLNLDFSYTTQEATKTRDGASVANPDEADTDGEVPDGVTPDMGKLFSVNTLKYAIEGTDQVSFRRQTNDGPAGQLDDVYRIGDGTYSEIDYETSNNIIDLSNLVEESSDTGVFDGLTPPPAGGSGTLEGTLIFVDTSNQVWPSETFVAGGGEPTYEGPQENNWFQGDKLTLDVTAEIGQSSTS